MVNNVSVQSNSVVGGWLVGFFFFPPKQELLWNPVFPQKRKKKKKKHDVHMSDLGKLRTLWV